MGEKQKLLSKLNIKDYVNELEIILEEKQFDEEAKSLLLSVFYKIDNFYKDYLCVKKHVKSKNEYLEGYISIIKRKCNKIQIMKPNQIENNQKYIVDRKKGEIKCVPNEVVLLYAMYELEAKHISIEKYIFEDFTKICINDILNKGKILNNLEPIRDFNGWSWNLQIDNTENILSNLLFQNLLLLLGYDFVYDNFSKSNIMEILRKKLNSEGYEEAGVQFLEYFIEACIILYNNQSLENHQKCLKYKRSLDSKKKMLNTRKNQIDDTMKNSTNISKQIQSIDEMLNDIKLLRKEYEKCIEKNKKTYFGISDFVECKEQEKADLLEQIKSNNKVINQKQYIKNHDDYENTLKLYNEIQSDKEKVNAQPIIINLQKAFLECFKIKIQKSDIKKDLGNYMKDIRYYANILYKKNKPLMLEDKISYELEAVERALVPKIIEHKVIETGFRSKDLNYKILKYVFETKIIELENVVIKIHYIKSNKMEVGYYDAKELDHKEVIEIPFDEEIINKRDKKIKLLKIGG